MSLQPLADRVLVKRIEEAEEKTQSGIIIPETAKEKSMRAQVIAVGPGKKNKDGNSIAMTVKEQDIIVFNKYAGTEVNVDGQDLLIMREDDILAVEK